MNESSRLLRRASVPLLPAMLATVPDAEAQVLYTPDQNLQISASDPASSRIFFDLDHSAGSGPFAQFSADGSQPAGTDFSVGFDSSFNGTENVVNPGVGKAFADNSANGSGLVISGIYALKFGAGETISADSGTFLSGSRQLFHADGTETPWSVGDSGYLGLQLAEGYGWAQISIGEESITLHDFAFNPEGAIAAGGTSAVPEPATGALLAAALAGSMAVFQRRRQKKALAPTTAN